MYSKIYVHRHLVITIAMSRFARHSVTSPSSLIGVVQPEADLCFMVTAIAVSCAAWYIPAF